MDALPDKNSIRSEAALEAINRLGLLRPVAQGTIEALLLMCAEQHPRSVCSTYRKRGVQISGDRKRALKIRANAFMSREALAEISDAGMADPIRAHETTLLRATFTMFRYRNAASLEQMLKRHPEYPVEIFYDVAHHDSCGTCLSLDKKPVPPDWGIFPPVDCTCITAPYGLDSKVDFLAPVIKAEIEDRAASEGSVMSRLKAFFGRS